MKKTLFSLFFLLSVYSFATHNRAGEILYKRMEPRTQVVGGVELPYYKYLITVIKYTDDGTTASPNNNEIADRCVDTVFFGDGKFEVVNRNNGGATVCSACAPCGCAHCGEIIIDEQGYRV